MDIFEIAMEKELEVKAYYEKIAAETPHPGIKNIFTLLAVDEQNHYDVVQSLRNKANCGVLSDSSALETAQKVLGEFFGDMAPAAHLKKSLDSYHHALLVEAESVKFYENILETVTDESLKKVLTTILAQEKEHYNIVENLYDYVLKPEYFLAWAEFSNIRSL